MGVIELVRQWLLPAFRTYDRIARLWSTMGLLISLHAEIARQEWEREQRRLGSGIALLSVAAMLFAFALGGLHLALVAYLMEEGWRTSEALLAVAGGDVVLAGLLAWRGRTRLQDPLMPQTRAMVTKTAEQLKAGA